MDLAVTPAAAMSRSALLFSRVTGSGADGRGRARFHATRRPCTRHLAPPRGSLACEADAALGLRRANGLAARCSGALRARGGGMSQLLLDAAGRRRSPATMPG